MPTATNGAQTLERGLAVLTELAREGGRSTAELAQACGLNRSVAHRLLVSLVRAGYARRDGEGRYSLGPVAIGLAGGPRLHDVARPELERLARELDATASLVEEIGGAAVTTMVAEPPTDGPRFSYRLGSRDPLDRGAGGLAVLASAPPRPGEPERVAEVRTVGIVVTYAELNPGAYGIAAPLPGWPRPAAVTVVSGREELTSSAAGPLERAVAAIGAERLQDGRSS